MFYPMPIYCPTCNGEADIREVQVSLTEGLIFHVTCCNQEYLFAVTWDSITKYCFEKDRESMTLQ